MFNATYFRYDGKWSGTYGLQIADFDDGAVKEIDTFSPTLSLQKVPGAVRFYYGGIEYDSAPTCEFSVLSEQELTGDMRRLILSWLVGRKQFKPMQFQDGDNDELTYYCVFTSAKTIWVNGRCHGFRLTAQFDSPFARGEKTTLSIDSADDWQNKTIYNKSDIVDDYVYPVVTFTATGEDAALSIKNLSDTSVKSFDISGLTSGETISIDNEMKHISSSLGGTKLECFTSKHWLRLVQGNNQLQVLCKNGTASISCPHYAMIGF